MFDYDWNNNYEQQISSPYTIITGDVQRLLGVLLAGSLFYYITFWLIWCGPVNLMDTVPKNLNECLCCLLDRGMCVVVPLVMFNAGDLIV